MLFRIIVVGISIISIIALVFILLMTAVVTSHCQTPDRVNMCDTSTEYSVYVSYNNISIYEKNSSNGLLLDLTATTVDRIDSTYYLYGHDFMAILTYDKRYLQKVVFHHRLTNTIYLEKIPRRYHVFPVLCSS